MKDQETKLEEIETSQTLGGGVILKRLHVYRNLVYLFHLFSLLCFYYQSIMVSEQPSSNGQPIRHTVLWEGIRTTHKMSGSPMGHVPWARLQCFFPPLLFPYISFLRSENGPTCSFCTSKSSKLGSNMTALKNHDRPKESDPNLRHARLSHCADDKLRTPGRSVCQAIPRPTDVANNSWHDACTLSGNDDVSKPNVHCTFSS